jgi:hypothetical protein
VKLREKLSTAHRDTLQAAHDHLVTIGASCGASIAEALRVEDSVSSRVDELRRIARAMFQDPDRPYDSPYVYVRDCFDTDVIIQCGEDFYQIPYTMDAQGAITLGKPFEVDIAYIPSDDAGVSETAGDEIVERKLPAGARKKLSAAAKVRKEHAMAKGAPNGEGVAEAARAAAAAGVVDLTEGATEIGCDFAAIREAAVGSDGTALLRIITPGWGSSGYYAPAVLKRDGPKVFKSGTKMFWNHQTPVEEAQRPEGDLDDLAGELAETAVWNESGPEGPGLYARAKVFSAFRPTVDELAPHIGVSIRAMGRAKDGEAEGRTGQIIETITGCKSIDYVTSPGAGGRILELFEAARQRPRVEDPVNQTQTVTDKALLERMTAIEQSNASLLETNASLRKSVIIGDARTFVESRLTVAAKTLPASAIVRLRESILAVDPPSKENRLDTEAFGKTVTDAIAREAAYVAELTGSGKVRGLGSAPTESEAKTFAEADTRLAASFQDLGLSKETAQLAVAGRG